MNILEIMKERHSVRKYTERAIEPEKREVLNNLVAEINQKTGLNIQILYDEPECFSKSVANYGKLIGVGNYIALVGKKGDDLDETTGYYGEELVIKAQELGLNTCWAALTHGKSKAIINKGEKEACLIALGYGATEGVPHKNRPLSEICNVGESSPQRFKDGIEAVMLAPTAINQQKFYFTLNDDGSVSAKAKLGMYTKMDLGIAKYHFEAVTGKKVK